MPRSVILAAAAFALVACTGDVPPAGFPEVTMSRPEMYPDLTRTVEALLAESGSIPADRRANLDRLADWIRGRLEAGDPARLTFICTHNSRRSHMAQLWAQVGAAWFGLDAVETYSGGTEATAFNPRAAAAMERAGFRVEGDTAAANPRYRVQLSGERPPMEAFSKVYDQPPNPASGYCAVMTCDTADAGCPIVFGADERIAVTYVDPKESDGTDAEAATYDERCRQIGREMLYALSRAAGAPVD